MQVFSATAGTSIKTEVTTTGNSQVNVQSNVKGESSSTVSVNSTNNASATTQSTSDGKIYKKIEVEVNGKKKTVETTEPGTTTVEINNGNATVSTQVKPQYSDDIRIGTGSVKTIHTESSSITQYIIEKIQSMIEKLFSKWWHK